MKQSVYDIRRHTMGLNLYQQHDSRLMSLQCLQSSAMHDLGQHQQHHCGATRGMADQESSSKTILPGSKHLMSDRRLQSQLGRH